MMQVSLRLLICLLLLTSVTSFASVGEAEFRKAVDILNCHAVQTSLAKLRSSQPLNEFRAKYPACTENSRVENIPSFLKENDKTKSITDTSALANEIDELKTRFLAQEWTSESVTDFLVDRVFTEIDPAGASNGKIRVFPGDRSKLTELQVAVRASLVRFFHDPVSSPSPTLTIPLIPPSDPSTLRSVDIVFLILIFASIAFCFWVWQGPKKRLMALVEQRLLMKANSSQLTEISRKVESLSPSNSYTKESLENRFKGLENQIAAVASDVDELKEKEKRRPAVPSVPESTPSEHDIRDWSKTNQKDVLYFPTPNQDRTFDVDSGQRSFKEGASIYRFTLISPTEAKFQIDSHPTAVELAMSDPARSIERVCRAKSTFLPNATRINTPTGEEGIVELSGDKWRVTRDANIYYEH